MKADDIAHRLEEQMRAGLLPLTIPSRTRAALGSGAKCAACDMPMRSDVEMEASLPDGRTGCFHRDCLFLFAQVRERVAREKPA